MTNVENKEVDLLDQLKDDANLILDQIEDEVKSLVSNIKDKATADQAINSIGNDVLISYTSIEKLTGGKKNEQQGRITKITEGLTVTIIGNGHYTQAKKDAGDVDFVAQPRKWGVRNESGLIEHNGELYVEFIVKSKGTSKYLLDDKPIEKIDIVGIAVTKIDSEKEPIILRAVKLKNITNISTIV